MMSSSSGCSSSSSSFEREKQVAIAAATTAAKVCEHVRQTMVVAKATMTKDDKSPVTVADFAAQAVVCRALLETFPNDPVVAEEDSSELQKNPEHLQAVTDCVQTVLPQDTTTTSENVLKWIDHGNGQLIPSTGRYWTLDPIDGTKGFLRQDQYAIALALVSEGQVQVGVLACPALTLDTTKDGQQSTTTGILFVAVRGQGATMQPLSLKDSEEEDATNKPQPIQVIKKSSSTITDCSAHFCFVESVESAHGNQSLQSSIAQAVGITAQSIRMDSQAKYGVVASGKAVLYLRLPNPKQLSYKENIWDHAAGVVLVEEAGGKVTDMYGQMLDFSTGSNKLTTTTGVVVSNGEIHDQVLAALKQHQQQQQQQQQQEIAASIATGEGNQAKP